MLRSFAERATEGLNLPRTDHGKAQANYGGPEMFTEGA